MPCSLHTYVLHPVPTECIMGVAGGVDMGGAESFHMRNLMRILSKNLLRARYIPFHASHSMPHQVQTSGLKSFLRFSLLQLEPGHVHKEL